MTNQPNRQNNQRRQNQNQNQNRPISLQELKALANGELIPIPSFVSGDTIMVRVRKVDMSAIMTSAGVIPNKLQSEVVQQFEQGKSEHQVAEQIKGSITQSGSIDTFLPMIDTLVERALVEPTYADFEETYPLTLEQKMAIFNWTMGEVNSFRPSNKQSRSNPNANRQRKDMGNKTK